MGWNPLNWKITDTLQGQEGGYSLDPFSGVGSSGNLTNAIANSNQVQPTSSSPTTSAAQQASGGMLGGAKRGVVLSASTDVGALSPYTDNSSYGTYGYGSAGGARTAVSNNNAYYDAQMAGVNDQIARLDRQAPIGYSNIDNSYNQSYNKLLGNKAVAERDYNLNRDRSMQDNLSARSDIDSRVRSRATGLQRLFGSTGGGNSSWSKDLAPLAAAREGTQMRQGVDQAYGRNMQNMDMSWEDFNRNFNQSQADLETQKMQKRNEFDSGIQQTRASLLEQLATLGAQRAQDNGMSYQQAMATRQPYESQLRGIYNQIDQLGNQYSNPVIKANDVRYAAPELSQYTRNNFSNVTPTSNQAVNEQVAPYWTLLGNNKDRNQYSVY